MAKTNPLNQVSHTSQQGDQWHIFRGKAVEDKAPESRELKVQLDEQMPYMEGKLEKIENEAPAGDVGIVKTSNYVTATYMGLESNRTFPPDIYQGEQVVVFNYGDSDKYYWYSSGRDDNMRRVERLRFHVADLQQTVKELNEDNTYFIEFDTLHNKRILIQTAKTDGEKYRYLLQFDAKENTIRICDDGDNEILVESDTPRVFLRNRDGTYIDANKRNLILFAPEDIVFKAGRQIIEDTPMKTARER